MSQSITDVNLSALDLNLLYVLHVVLEERSVARASSRLHVTGPAVSNALARLRSALGDPLLVRDGRGLTPTPRALELAPALRRVFADLQTTLQGAQAFSARETTRTFTIACSDGDQLTTVPRLAQLVARRMPRARLRVVSLDLLAAGGGLETGEVDVALAPPEAPQSGVHRQDLYEDDAVIVLRRDHPRARGRLTKDAFNALHHVDTWLVLGKPGEGHRHAEAFIARHGLKRTVTVIVPSFSAAAMVAATTDNAASMPRRVAVALRRALGLKVLELPTPPMRLRMQMVWHERTHHDAGSQAFRALLVDASA